MFVVFVAVANNVGSNPTIEESTLNFELFILNSLPQSAHVNP